MTSKLAKTSDNRPAPITIESDSLPQMLDAANIPPALAALDRREQLILVCIAANMRVCDIATLCNTTSQNISRFITEHDLRKWVSLITPEHLQSFRETRWRIAEQAALTRAMSGLSEMSPMQAGTFAAISSDKQASIRPPAQCEGDAPGELEAQLTIRFKRK